MVNAQSTSSDALDRVKRLLIFVNLTTTVDLSVGEAVSRLMIDLLIFLTKKPVITVFPPAAWRVRLKKQEDDGCPDPAVVST